MISLLVSLALLSLWLAPIDAAVLAFTLNIERKLVNLDGYVRDGVTVNGNYIGPTIEATVGDTLLITVWNYALMQEVVTLHWHGFQQKGTPWADGTAFVTNCPLTHGSSFTYNFTVTDEGTFWYHAHVGSLNMEGSAGMIVVYSHDDSPNALVQTRSEFSTHTYDAELHIILSDWYHPSVYTMNAMVEHNPFKWVGNGDSILINGKGESKLCSYNGTTTTVTTTLSDGSSKTVTSTCKGNREIFQLDRTKLYLVRVLNAANLAFFNLAIAGHYFTILGVDGNSYAQPVDVNSLDLSSGQRVMAILHFNSTIAAVKEAGTYLMQVQTDWSGPDFTTAGIAHAYVTYGDSTSSISSSEVSNLVPPNESRDWQQWYDEVRAMDNISSLSQPTCPGNSEVTKTIQLDGIQQYVDMNTGRGLDPASVTPGTPNTKLAWTVFNNSRQMMPPTPYLLSAFLNKPSSRSVSSSDVKISAGENSLSANPAESHTRRLSPTSSLAAAANTATKVLTNLYEVFAPKLVPSESNTENLNDGIAIGNHELLSALHFETEAGAMDSSSAMDRSKVLSPIRIEYGDVVDVVVQAYASGSGGCDVHPWHLHGHSFWLVARGSGLYNATAVAAAMSGATGGYTTATGDSIYIFPHPLLMDTVSGYPSNYSQWRGGNGVHSKGVWRDPCGWFVVRFRADNPGMWAFHCHVGWHMEMGMGVTFDEASELVGAPPADYGMCGAAGEYSTHSSFAASEDSLSDSSKRMFAKSSVFSILVSVVTVLFVLVVVALLYAWLGRRKFNGMFYSVDLHPHNESEHIANPISSTGSGDDVCIVQTDTDSVDVEGGSGSSAGRHRGGNNGGFTLTTWGSSRELEMTTFTTDKNEGEERAEGYDDDVEISFVDSSSRREAAGPTGQQKGQAKLKKGKGNIIGRTFSTFSGGIVNLEGSVSTK